MKRYRDTGGLYFHTSPEINRRKDGKAVPITLTTEKHCQTAGYGPRCRERKGDNSQKMLYSVWTVKRMKIKI